jgi:hypothetical protein
MSLLAKFCGELKRDNGELKVVCQKMKRDNSDMKKQLAHDAMVDDHHPLLPVSTSHSDIGKGVRYFYTKPCGHLLSVEAKHVMFECDLIITFKEYKNRLLPRVSEIIIKSRGINGRTTTISKDNCKRY